MKRIAVLGSTGSIGRSTLDVIRQLPGKFRVAALSTNSNIQVLRLQMREFHPSMVCVNDKNAALNLGCGRSLNGARIFCGEEGLGAMLREKGIEKIVLAISGSSALEPLLAAIDNGLDVALANKEALAMAGPIIMRRVKAKKVKILPVDSEQSAIWQCLEGRDAKKIKRIYLTASGGPFRRSPRKRLGNVSIKEVLRHPRWKMGAKITVDSATMMNKGLEVLEAISLFNVAADKIKVLIHPEAIIHSMVEFIDGVILAQLSVADMRIPIQYAVSYPERLPNALTGIDFARLKGLNFEMPDFKKFPCLGLAYEAARQAGVAPCVLNAANEVAVERFLNCRIKFISIPVVIEKVLRRHRNKLNPRLEDILKADSWARQEACRVIDAM
jgi:1-deoxy-D-xylulose-5-phosphate reductoisomerase